MSIVEYLRFGRAWKHLGPPIPPERYWGPLYPPREVLGPPISLREVLQIASVLTEIYFPSNLQKVHERMNVSYPLAQSDTCRKCFSCEHPQLLALLLSLILSESSELEGKGGGLRVSLNLGSILKCKY